MLNRLHVKGYKSLTDVEMALKPLTLLFWPNEVSKDVRRKQFAVSCGFVRLG